MGNDNNNSNLVAERETREELEEWAADYLARSHQAIRRAKVKDRYHLMTASNAGGGSGGASNEPPKMPSLEDVKAEAKKRGWSEKQIAACFAAALYNDLETGVSPSVYDPHSANTATGPASAIEPTDLDPAAMSEVCARHGLTRDEVLAALASLTPHDLARCAKNPALTPLRLAATKAAFLRRNPRA